METKAGGEVQWRLNGALPGPHTMALYNALTSQVAAILGRGGRQSSVSVTRQGVFTIKRGWTNEGKLGWCKDREEHGRQNRKEPAYGSLRTEQPDQLKQRNK
jgi:hypothetical protein